MEHHPAKVYCAKFPNTSGRQITVRELLSATMDAVKEPCTRYHCTMVFSTAIQPSFQAMTDWKPTEILPGLLDQLRRTRATWRLDVRTPLADIVRETLQQRNACAIVNLRDQASALVSLLHEERGSDEGSVLPDHRFVPGPPDPGGGNALH